MTRPLDLRSRAQGTGVDRPEGFVSFLGTRASRPHKAWYNRGYLPHLNQSD